MNAQFFASPEEMRNWLEASHESAAELWVGIYKKGAGRSGIGLREAQDAGLCFGWIDNKGQRIDGERYAVRFTPRRPNSNWSAVNVARAEALITEGLMHEAGRRAFERRRT